MTPIFNPGGGAGGGGSDTPPDRWGYQLGYGTAALAENAGESGQVTGNGACVATGISADGPCRVRMYLSEAQRDADVARPAGTDPTGDHGLLLDVVLTAGDLDIGLAPPALLVDPDLHTSEGIPIRVENLDAATETRTVTINIVDLSV
jgi:hypothetical protein